MGNKLCSACDCNHTEPSTELDLKSNVRTRQQFMLSGNKTDSQSLTTRESSILQSGREKRPDRQTYEHPVDKITIIQAAWRGYQDRKQLVHLKKQSQANYPYFSMQEIKETLSRYMGPPTQQDDGHEYVYKNGGVYIGQWIGGFRHGQGVMKWPDGAEYNGQWDHSKPMGSGTFTHIDGDSFIGEWHMFNSSISKLSREDRVQKVQLRDGYSISHTVWLVYKQDQFKQTPPKRKPTKDPSPKIDRKMTELTERFRAMEATVAELKSTIAAGLKPMGGRGREVRRVKYPNNNVYEGELIGEKRDGRGKNTWNNGDTYDGDWKDDLQSGFGRNVWVDGSEYTGEYYENKKHGVGSYTWEDQSQYVGEWRDDKMEGLGKYSWPDGKYYFGEWLAGVLHGYGEFHWVDGKRYIGTWFQGKKHGSGTTYYPDGRTSKDNWVHGKVDQRE